MLRAQGVGSRVEFAVYGLLYAALLPRHLASELRGLPAAVLAEPAVQHALQVCKKQGLHRFSSISVQGDFCLLQKLYKCEFPCICNVSPQTLVSRS